MSAVSAQIKGGNGIFVLSPLLKVVNVGWGLHREDFTIRTWSDLLCLSRDVSRSKAFIYLTIDSLDIHLQSKLIVLVALVASASAFAPAPAAFVRSTAIYNEDKKGAGGMFDTRDPEPFEDSDPRKSISAAPSFEEYMKQRAAEQAGGN